MTNKWSGALPSGKETDSYGEYVDAWRALCEPIEELTGIGHWAFDPCVSFHYQNKNLELPVWFLELVNKALRNAEETR